jgi:hypothetical protein
MVTTGGEIFCHVIEIKYLDGYNKAKRLCQQIKTRVGARGQVAHLQEIHVNARQQAGTRSILQ